MQAPRSKRYRLNQQINHNGYFVLKILQFDELCKRRVYQRKCCAYTDSVYADYRFMRNRANVTAVLKLMNEVLEHFEVGGSTALILADMRKAFDCVSHCQLLDKLLVYEVHGVIHQVSLQIIFDE